MEFERKRMTRYIEKFKKHYNLGDQDIVYCKVCGKIANDIHHIQFRSQGGKDEIENLIALCRNCHDKAHYKTKPFLTKDNLKEYARK